MTTFDRHILRRLLATTLVLIGMLTSFFILLHYLEYIDDFIDRGASESLILWSYYPNALPFIFHQITPAALFLACIHLTGKLAQELQLTAVYTAGVSFYRVLRPILFFGLLVSIGMFYMNGWVLPKTEQIRIGIEAKYLNKGREQLESTNNLFRQLEGNRILQIGSFSTDQKAGFMVSVQTYDAQKHLISRADADQMQWNDKQQQWTFQNVVTHTFRADSTILRSQTQHNVTAQLEIKPEDLSRSANDVDLLNIPEAKQYLQELQKSGISELGKPMVAYYAKFTYPFASLIVVLLGFSLASTRRKGGQAAQLSIGIMVAFIYLAMIKTIEPFGYSGELEPMVATLFPHVFFLTMAILMMFLAKK
ncbi:MAG TPA: LptF/LptG family permease [Rhodothermales bacterium]|nr:LptF/LptG family permease [Rhodothermales bacterium]HRR10185.1 LptF/LptG family permease [Rhodothermales bacterium]